VFDLRVINGTVVTEAGVLLLDVGIQDGKIAELAEPGALGPARDELDASGLHVIPGAVDVHFHCRAPSHPERGDFGSETAAAVSGGVTTVFEMPISLPACSTPEVMAQRQALIEHDAYCNVALYSGAVLGGRAEAEAMAAAGAIGFKLFTISPPPGREAEFEGLWATDEAEMYETLVAIAPTGLRTVVHAENESLLRFFAGRGNGGSARPPVVEAVAIGIISAIAADVGTPIHIAHVSSERALSVVRGAKDGGTLLSAETCPQYLTLDTSAIESFGGIAKIAPPLRRHSDSVALWSGLADRSIDVLSSDHSPFLVTEKSAVAYERAPMGLPTVELLVPVILDAVANGRLTLERAIELVAAQPARLFGLYPAKGVIAVGSDADIALASLNQTFRPSAESFRSRAAGCAVVYSHLELRGTVIATIVGGEVIYAEGDVLNKPTGRFVSGPTLAVV
jgi:dihydroorotase (multifunctional complex type)